MIKVIFWDIGGVLVINNAKQVTSEWAQQLKVDPKVLQSLSKEYSNLRMTGQNITYTEFVSKKKISWISPEQLENFQSEIWSSETVNTPILEFINQTYTRYIYGIITNNFSQSEELLLKKYHIPKFYKIFISSSEIGILKPDPRIFTYALNQAQVQPFETILIDNSLTNIQSAQVVGIRGIHFQNNAQLIRELQELGIN